VINKKQDTTPLKALLLLIIAAFSCQTLIDEIQYSGMFVAE